MAFLVSTSALYSRPEGVSPRIWASTFDRGVVRVGAGGNMVDGAERLHVPDAAQRDGPLAILRRLLGVGPGQRARRARDRAELRLDQRQRLGLVELARHQQHGVVRLIVGAPERLQPLDRHVFDVGARADGDFAVVVPEIGGGEDALRQDAGRDCFRRISYSLRTTVISLSRSFLAMKEWTMRSASRSSAQSRLSSVAWKVSK